MYENIKSYPSVSISSDHHKMEETRKRDGCHDADDDMAAVKRSRNEEAGVCTTGDLDDDVVAWLSLDDDTMDELMKFLDTDTEGASCSSSSSSSSGSNRVKFIENPYSSPLIFQSSCSYITINGNEESCGSSFSDWESSVMASVDMGRVMSNAGKVSESDEFCEWFQGGKGGAWGVNEVEEARGVDRDWEEEGVVVGKEGVF